MVRALSPYYVTTPFVSPASGDTCTDYTLYIFLWDGAKASVPGTATYERTKPNPTGSTGSDKINIARLIADYIDFTPQEGSGTGEIFGNNQWWVYTEVTYTTVTASDATTPQLGSTKLFARGYSYGIEGENIETVTNNIMMQGTEFKVSRTGVFVVPVIVDEAVTKALTVVSSPDSEINYSKTVLATTDSAELSQYVWVDLSETTTDTSVTVTFDGNTVDLIIQDEYKYTPIDIFFQNKLGAEQSLTFFKERTDSLSVSSSEFESDRGQSSAGNHQFITFNVQGEATFKANSGWVDESNNEIFRQLMLSERIWHYDGTDFIPLNIKTKSQQWKTQLKEKLISYEIEFKMSYNEINSI